MKSFDFSELAVFNSQKAKTSYPQIDESMFGSIVTVIHPFDDIQCCWILIHGVRQFVSYEFLEKTSANLEEKMQDIVESWFRVDDNYSYEANRITTEALHRKIS